jgi:hypothetical protein
VLHSDNRFECFYAIRWGVRPRAKRPYVQGSKGPTIFDRANRPCSGRAAHEKAAAPGRCGFAARRIGCVGQCSWSPSAAEPDEFSVECPHEGAAGVAQLGAAETGSADGMTVAGFDAGAALRARLAADFFFAGDLLALAFLADFLADFFGAAALDFLADFFADLAFFAVFFAALFEDFFADFFFAVTVLFLPFLAFLPAFFFLPLAIVILLLPPINVYRAFKSSMPHVRGPSISSIWFRTACRPIEKLNRVHYRN